MLKSLGLAHPDFACLEQHDQLQTPNDITTSLACFRARTRDSFSSALSRNPRSINVATSHISLSQPYSSLVSDSDYVMKQAYCHDHEQLTDQAQEAGRAVA